MARKTPHTSTQTSAGPLGRVRQMFSRKGAGEKGAANAAMASQLRGAEDSVQAIASKKGVFTATATGADRAIGRAHGMLSRVNQIAVFGGMAAGMLGAMGKLPLVGGMFNKAAVAVRQPDKFMENTTVKDLGNKLSPSRILKKVGDTVTEKKGAESAAADRLLNAHKGVSFAEAKVGSTVGTALNKVSGTLGEAVEKHASGMLGKLSGSAGRRAARHSTKAQGALDAMIASGSGNDALADVTGKLEAAKKMFGAGKKLDTEAYSGLLGEAQEGLAGLAKGAVDKKTLSGLQKGLKSAGEAGSLASQRGALAEKIANMPTAIKNAPETLANANLKNVALKGAVVTGTALQITGTARGIGEKVHTLKELYCDITGEKKISTRKLLTSKNVPDVVKEARSHILKEFGPRVVLNFANTIATYTFMKNTNMKSMIGSFGLNALTSLHTAKVQSYGILPMYEALSKVPQIQDVQYAGFIAAASKDAAAAGGIESPLVQALAVDYAREGTRPAEILKEIQNGRFDERAMQKVQENKAAMQQSGGYAAPQSASAREVVGAHTQRLQNEARGSAQAR